MQVVIRRSEDNQWGFVESYKVYRYVDNGSITVTVGITPEGKFATPYIMRGSSFIPASQIEEEMGIAKYIKAKKPFYCLLQDGFVATIKAGVNFATGEIIEDKTTYKVYRCSNREGMLENKGKLNLVSILTIPDNVEELMLNLAKELAKTKGSREEYFKIRF